MRHPFAPKPRKRTAGELKAQRQKHLSRQRIYDEIRRIRAGEKRTFVLYGEWITVEPGDRGPRYLYADRGRICVGHEYKDSSRVMSDTNGPLKTPKKIIGTIVDSRRTLNAQKEYELIISERKDHFYDPPAWAQQIESAGSFSKAYLMSGTKQYIRVLREHGLYSTLLIRLSADSDATRVVITRINALLDQAYDTRYARPYDLALAVYLLALHDTSVYSSSTTLERIASGDGYIVANHVAAALLNGRVERMSA